MYVPKDFTTAKLNKQNLNRIERGIKSAIGEELNFRYNYGNNLLNFTNNIDNSDVWAKGKWDNSLLTTLYTPYDVYTRIGTHHISGDFGGVGHGYKISKVVDMLKNNVGMSINSRTYIKFCSYLNNSSWSNMNDSGYFVVSFYNETAPTMTNYAYYIIYKEDLEQNGWQSWELDMDSFFTVGSFSWANVKGFSLHLDGAYTATIQFAIDNIHVTSSGDYANNKETGIPTLRYRNNLQSDGHYSSRNRIVGLARGNSELYIGRSGPDIKHMILAMDYNTSFWGSDHRSVMYNNAKLGDSYRISYYTKCKCTGILATHEFNVPNPTVQTYDFYRMRIFAEDNKFKMVAQQWTGEDFNFGDGCVRNCFYKEVSRTVATDSFWQIDIFVEQGIVTFTALLNNDFGNEPVLMCGNLNGSPDIAVSGSPYYEDGQMNWHLCSTQSIAGDLVPAIQDSLSNYKIIAN